MFCRSVVQLFWVWPDPGLRESRHNGGRDHCQVRTSQPAHPQLQGQKKHLSFFAARTENFQVFLFILVHWLMNFWSVRQPHLKTMQLSAGLWEVCAKTWEKKQFLAKTQTKKFRQSCKNILLECTPLAQWMFISSQCRVSPDCFQSRPEQSRESSKHQEEDTLFLGVTNSHHAKRKWNYQCGKSSRILGRYSAGAELHFYPGWDRSSGWHYQHVFWHWEHQTWPQWQIGGTVQEQNSHCSSRWAFLSKVSYSWRRAELRTRGRVSICGGERRSPPLSESTSVIFWDIVHCGSQATMVRGKQVLYSGRRSTTMWSVLVPTTATDVSLACPLRAMSTFCVLVKMSGRQVSSCGLEATLDWIFCHVSEDVKTCALLCSFGFNKGPTFRNSSQSWPYIAAGKLISGDINDPGYFATNGTSFAAPHATAIAANIIATAGKTTFLAVCLWVFDVHVQRLPEGCKNKT